MQTTLENDYLETLAPTQFDALCQELRIMQTTDAEETREFVRNSINRGEHPTIKSEYDLQAHCFLAKHGLKFRATLSDSKAPSWEDDPDPRPRHHFRVTISKRAHGRSFDNQAKRITFDFFGSISDAEKGIVTVKPYDVLACISSDACAPESFADYCAEYGEDEDSIRALQTFRRVDRFAKRLRAFFTPGELQDLAEIQ